MYSNPTLTGLSVWKGTKGLHHMLKRQWRLNVVIHSFSPDCVWRAKQSSGMPKDLRGPKTGLRYKPLVIAKAKERKKLHGSSARSSGHHLCCLFEEICKNQIVLELYDDNQISWAIILTLTFNLAHSLEIITTPCLSFLTNRNGCIQITLT